MPIYMDRHDVSNEVTAESVARLHIEDLKIQHKYNCRGLSYWFDDKRKTAFCLVEAPNAESVHNMHQHAHGQLPHSIIEVDASLVESFLGRMEDPNAESGTELNIIDEPAFRFLLTVQIQMGELGKDLDKNLVGTVKNLMHKVIEVIRNMQGTVVPQNSRHILASFTTAQHAVDCGMALNTGLKEVYPLHCLHIGLDAGPPVEGSKSLFENTIRTSRRLCEMSTGFSISPSVLKMYQNEALESNLNANEITKIKVTDMVFLNKLYDFLEANFSNPEVRMDTFSKALGRSRSQVYRNSMALLGCSPYAYLNKYRLKKSLDKLDNPIHTISETAFSCGFSSASYFSKCFRSMYGISPKEYKTTILS